MDFYATLAVSFALLLAAAAMMVSHLRAWRSFRQKGLDAEELDYRRRQFRRRMQTSAMLGVLAVALSVGQAATTWWIRSGWFAAAYWLATMFGACWVGLLALVDIWATKHYYGRLRHNCLIGRAKLEAELRRIQSVRGNGRKRDQGSGIRGQGPGIRDES